MEIAVYNYTFRNEVLQRLQESIMDRELHYFASELTELGVMENDDMLQAINRAMQICRTNGIPVRAHFKSIYLSRGGQLFADWRLSDLGRKLVLLNGNPLNPVIARLQLEILK